MAATPSHHGKETARFIQPCCGGVKEQVTDTLGKTGPKSSILAAIFNLWVLSDLRTMPWGMLWVWPLIWLKIERNNSSPGQGL